MQRQPRLGDILDDYCPRERRVTNHAVVAMVGSDVKQTRCTTCDAEHEFKHAKVPRQRRKAESTAALFSQVAASAPKRVASDSRPGAGEDAAREVARKAHADGEPPGIDSLPREAVSVDEEPGVDARIASTATVPPVVEEPGPDAENVTPTSATLESENGAEGEEREEGPVHRPLIRASFPRPVGQPPSTRPAPEFTIRQPDGRQSRFRPRHPRGGQQAQGGRSNGNASGGTFHGAPRQGGRPPVASRLNKRHGPGRKRTK